MSNGTISHTTSAYNLSALGAELASIAEALSRVSAKLQNASIKQTSINKSSDPEMFTKEFISEIKQSKKELQNGDVISFDSL